MINTFVCNKNFELEKRNSISLKRRKKKWKSWNDSDPMIRNYNYFFFFYSVSFDFTKKKMERIWKMRIQRGGEKHVHPRNDLIGREEKLIINESLRRVDNA